MLHIIKRVICGSINFNYQLNRCWNRGSTVAIQCLSVSRRDGFCSKPISRYPIPRKEDLDEDIQARMDEVEEKTKFIPNVFKALAHRPAEFRAFFDYYDALMMKETGSLTKADRELIVVATSSYNNCQYCVVSHGALHRIFSKNPVIADQVAVNWKCSDIDDRQRAMLQFAMVVCKSQTVTEAHFEALEKHGFDREDAWDIGAIASLFALSNRMAHLTNMRPNEEFHLIGRLPKKDN
ncbi:uncharacterized protein LOC117102256 [Anneissia japonica]|uniref:uncharacterized protein LOC117102256 n=1 Tax=Anneissia japonica TaxID=1529436 RepID=UPI001425799A|nr:uncharacterized protein LOC117102256 [Anneissia japonica]